MCRLENTNVTEDYVFFIDADMLFLRCAHSACRPAAAR